MDKRIKFFIISFWKMLDENKYSLTSHSPIELAIPAPYPLIYPFSLQAPNSRVNQYKVPSLDKSFYCAPHDKIPIS